ncbi:hypothetical protein [Actinomadura sp. RB99]|uniref:hypothetical protein n=1 Tax=Actinomadura sp. RB99 TaxID=2691577 RepID=UPI001686CC93|nr:hypothetical protein [Actinomadura sp. RB99]
MSASAPPAAPPMPSMPDAAGEPAPHARHAAGNGRPVPPADARSEQVPAGGRHEERGR